MSITSFTSGATTFEKMGDNTFINSSLVFGDPADQFTLRPVTVNGNVYRFGISRRKEKAGTGEASGLVYASTVSISVTTTSDFTPTELDGLINDLSNALTVENISDILLGDK